MLEKNNSDTEPLLKDSSKSSKTLDTNLYTEEDIKAKLQWYYKNPYEKYKDRGRKPFKLLIQVIKIVLVTLQATLFSVDEFSVVQFNTDNIETFRNLFLVDYAGEDLQELYQKKQVYYHMLYTWQQYYNFDHIMIGSYDIEFSGNTSYNYAPIELCISVQNLQVSPKVSPKISSNISWRLNVSEPSEKNKESGCRNLKPPPSNRKANETTLEEFIQMNNLSYNFEWILNFKLKFSFMMNNTTRHKSNTPDCYTFDIEIVFDNSDLDGIMTVQLDSSVNFRICRTQSGKLHIREYLRQKALWTTLDITIIVICITSFVLCVRSFKRHFKLSLDVARFFRDYRHEKFTLSDKLNFLSFWLVLIVLSDICSIAGSLIKILLDWLELPEIYNACSLCFGLAVLFSWIGVLRYLGFMRGYNTLLVTLKTAFPTIIRFSFCVSFIYLGFAVCGWIVFGPYHNKFRDLLVTSECLFSLINGDDMFATFSEMDDSDVLVWYFSKIYLYIFISLFIFVVLSLFIGIMADTYERIRDYGHPPKSRIELFMEGNEYMLDEQQHRHGAGSICHHQKLYNDSDTDSFDDSCQHDLSSD